MMVQPYDGEDKVENQPLDVGAYLQEREEQVLAKAHAAVGRARLAHYDAAGDQATDDRLRALLGVLIECCRSRYLDAAVSYADTLAAQRHRRGYTLAEVQTAINVLEEAVWQLIMTEAPPDAHGYALGSVATVLGVVKDRVACGFVDQMASHRAKTLRLDSLFGGTEG